VTIPATPRAFSRAIKMSPAEAARGSPRLSITRTWPAGQVSIALRCGWSGSA